MSKVQLTHCCWWIHCKVIVHVNVVVKIASQFKVSNLQFGAVAYIEMI